MATNYYVDAQGRYYSGAAPTSASDSQLPFISTNGAAVITTTPTSKQTVEDATKQIAIADHSLWKSQVKLR